MKIQICAEVEGYFLIKDNITAKLDPFEFALFDKQGKHYINVTKPVSDYIDYVPKKYVKDGLIHIEATKPEIYNDMKQWLYYIEAMGAFNFEIAKIHIDELEVNWIYETEEEKGTIPIPSLKRNKQERKAEKQVSASNLSNLLIFRKMLPEANISFNYYRQARNYFNEGDYYFAFINYFMMLEFCFAGGQFHKKEMTKKFNDSILLKLCILNAITMMEKDSKNSVNYSWLSNECQQKHQLLNFQGIVYLLIEYRGLLSHASERSKKYLFDNQSLRPLSFFIGLVCFLLCGYIQVYSCSDEDSKNRIIQQRIDQLEIQNNNLCHN